MKGITSAYLLSLIIAIVVADCPPSQEIYPCKCDADEHRILCEGSSITGDTLKKSLGDTFRKTEHNIFRTLVIVNTAVESISTDAIGSGQFYDIVIQNNSKLTRIDPSVFKEKGSYVTTLTIANNPYVKSDDLFELCRTLKYVTSIDFKRNNIRTIPSHAFRDLNYLNAVYLQHNRIDQIDDYALTFDQGSQKNHEFSVYLDDNKITAKSWASNSVENKRNTIVNLHVENNGMTYIPEKIFKPFVDNLGNFRAKNNPFECDCDMHWMIDHLSDTKQYHFVDVYCKKQEKMIFDLKEHDFSHCPHIENS